MPLYDFKCEACEHVEEYMVNSAIKLMLCEKCGEDAQRQVPAHTDHIRPLKEKHHRDLPTGTKPRYHGYSVE